MANTYSGLILTIATSFKLDPDLVAAQVEIESGGNPWAWNPEPRYRYLWDVKLYRPFRDMSIIEIRSDIPPVDFPSLAGDADNEWNAQRASWGLLQIMGAVAREHGFAGPYLTQLCDPETNLRIGCANLAGLLSWSGGDVTRALAAYNGGKYSNVVKPYRNQAYADKVLARREAMIGGSR